MLNLDPQKVAELVLRVYPHGLPRGFQESRGLYTGQANANIINAATRLIELMAQPGDAELLAPLVVDEILIRLLRSPKIEGTGAYSSRCFTVETPFPVGAQSLQRIDDGTISPGVG
jgi:hypothetical protein